MSPRLIISIALFELFILGFYATPDEEVYCYSNDTNPYRYFASKTPYNAVKGPGIELLDDTCKPQYVWLLMRHPARYAGDELYKSKDIEVLRDAILRNEKIKLCDEDQKLLKNWTFQGKDADHAEVSIQGIEDLKVFTERLRDVFEFFKNPPLDEKHFEFITSSKIRCSKCCEAFAQQFLSSENTGMCKIDDTLIRFEKKRDKKNLGETQDFKGSDEIKRVIHEVSARLGYTEDLEYMQVYQMYLLCAYDYSWGTDPKSPFCTAFEPHHLQIFEYLFDIMAYHARGYGNPDNMYQGEKFVNNLIDKLSTAAEDNSSSILASFYFIHSTTILPFLKQFGVYEDNEALTKDNFSTKGKERQFRSSLFDPFGANVAVVLYKCANETKLSFHLNENAFEIPDFNGNVCTLEQLKEKFNKRRMENSSSNDVSEQKRSKISNYNNKGFNNMRVVPLPIMY